MYDKLQAGDLVTAEYKSGRYIGRVTELTSSGKAAVQILAVIKHPDQGDLHHPMRADVAFFHQRRALAYQEIALMPLSTVKSYLGEVPDYKVSLREAVERQKAQLDNLRHWAERALSEIEILERDYFA